MVTLRRLPGLEAFSEIVAPGRCLMNEITKAFVHIIRSYHEGEAMIEKIECFSIMPDHIHLLIKLKGESKTRSEGWAFESEGKAAGKTLSFAVAGLVTALERAYWQKTTSLAHPSSPRPVFYADWHDWIVKRKKQLAAFTRYIRENPERRWLRFSHPEYFRRVNEIEFLGRKWYGYGNARLLGLPHLEPMRYSRKIVEGSEEWNVAVENASRIGPGGAGIGTFMSPCEKACGHALGLAGGRWIVLSPEGFGERWHPGRQYEKFCAEGRMLFLSLWPTMTREPTKAELYDRCHQMGDIIVNELKNED